MKTQGAEVEQAGLKGAPTFDPLLEELLQPVDEKRAPWDWPEARAQVSELAQRPAKRLRPGLVLLGFRLAGGARWLEPNVLVALGMSLLVRHRLRAQGGA